jgi:hypothetical protein
VCAVDYFLTHRSFIVSQFESELSIMFFHSVLVTIPRADTLATS